MGFLISSIIYTHCFRNPNSWWEANFEEIKSSLQTELDVGLIYFSKDMKEKFTVNREILEDRYTLMEQIGDGAESYVYKCEDFKEYDPKYKL